MGGPTHALDAMGGSGWVRVAPAVPSYQKENVATGVNGVWPLDAPWGPARVVVVDAASLARPIVDRGADRLFAPTLREVESATGKPCTPEAMATEVVYTASLLSVLSAALAADSGKGLLVAAHAAALGLHAEMCRCRAAVRGTAEIEAAHEHPAAGRPLGCTGTPACVGCLEWQRADRIVENHLRGVASACFEVALGADVAASLVTRTLQGEFDRLAEAMHDAVVVETLPRGGVFTPGRMDRRQPAPATTEADPRFLVHMADAENAAAHAPAATYDAEHTLVLCMDCRFEGNPACSGSKFPEDARRRLKRPAPDRDPVDLEVEQAGVAIRAALLEAWERSDWGTGEWDNAETTLGGEREAPSDVVMRNLVDAPLRKKSEVYAMLASQRMAAVPVVATRGTVVYDDGQSKEVTRVRWAEGCGSGDACALVASLFYTVSVTAVQAANGGRRIPSPVPLGVANDCDAHIALIQREAASNARAYHVGRMVLAEPYEGAKRRTAWVAEVRDAGSALHAHVRTLCQAMSEGVAAHAAHTAGDPPTSDGEDGVSTTDEEHWQEEAAPGVPKAVAFRLARDCAAACNLNGQDRVHSVGEVYPTLQFVPAEAKVVRANREVVRAICAAYGRAGVVPGEEKWCAKGHTFLPSTRSRTWSTTPPKDGWGVHGMDPVMAAASLAVVFAFERSGPRSIKDWKWTRGVGADAARMLMSIVEGGDPRAPKPDARKGCLPAPTWTKAATARANAVSRGDSYLPSLAEAGFVVAAKRARASRKRKRSVEDADDEHLEGRAAKVARMEAACSETAVSGRALFDAAQYAHACGVLSVPGAGRLVRDVAEWVDIGTDQPFPVRTARNVGWAEATHTLSAVLRGMVARAAYVSVHDMVFADRHVAVPAWDGTAVTGFSPADCDGNHTFVCPVELCPRGSSGWRRATLIADALET